MFHYDSRILLLIFIILHSYVVTTMTAEYNSRILYYNHIKEKNMGALLQWYYNIIILYSRSKCEYSAWKDMHNIQYT